MSAASIAVCLLFSLAFVMWLRSSGRLPEDVRKSPAKLAACTIALAAIVAYGGTKPTPPPPPPTPSGPWQHIEVPTKREQAKDGLKLWPSGKLDTRHAEGAR